LKDVKKRFFFEKEKQKTFAKSDCRCDTPVAHWNKRFLLLLFKKEGLASFALERPE
jgi:hypothetical protein